jgi:hypothetical protein
MNNRLPEKPEERLDVAPGLILMGAFTIRQAAGHGAGSAISGQVAR